MELLCLSCLGALIWNTYIEYLTHTGIVTYLAQSRLTWYRADLLSIEPAYLVANRQWLPDLRDSRLTAKLILRCNTCLESGKVTVEYRLLADLSDS